MIDEAMREKIEPKMTALFEEVRESYGAERCGFPYLPIVRDSFLDGPKVLICGKGEARGACSTPGSRASDPVPPSSTCPGGTGTPRS